MADLKVSPTAVHSVALKGHSMVDSMVLRMVVVKVAWMVLRRAVWRVV